MESKYPEQQTHGTVHHYEKILTQYDANTDTTTINKVTISENEYNSIIEGTNTFELPTGPVSVTTEKRIISVYDYELDFIPDYEIIKPDIPVVHKMIFGYNLSTDDYYLTDVDGTVLTTQGYNQLQFVF